MHAHAYLCMRFWFDTFMLILALKTYITIIIIIIIMRI